MHQHRTKKFNSKKRIELKIIERHVCFLHIKDTDNWQAGQGTIQIYILLRQIELCVLLSCC